MYSFWTSATVKWIKTLKNGNELLKQFEKELGQEVTTGFYRKYEDTFTLRVIEVASKVTGYTVEEVVRGTGVEQLENFVKQGYAPLVQCLGTSFYECLQHIDSLHRNLVNSYPNMVAPSFRPEMGENGYIFLHYYSSRPGLWPYAEALLISVAKVVYKIDVHFSRYQLKSDGKDHDIFKVWLPPEGFPQRRDAIAASLCTVSPTTREFDRLFPWHIQLDKTLRVLSLGSSLEHRFGDDLNTSELYFHDVCKVMQPSLLRQNFDEYAKYNNDSFLVIVRDEFYYTKKRQKKEERRLKKLARQEKYKRELLARSPRMQHKAAPSTQQQSIHRDPDPTLSSEPSAIAPADLLTPQKSQPTKLMAPGVCPMGNQSPRLTRASPMKETCPFSIATVDPHSSNSASEEEEEEEYDAGDAVIPEHALTDVRLRRVSGASSCSSMEAQAFISSAIDYLYLKGEIVMSEDGESLMFLGVPQVSSGEELYLRDLDMSELPVHSNAKDMLLATVHQYATISVASDLEQTQDDLAVARKGIEKEKVIVQELLDSILPRKIAFALERGLVPEPETFPSVSILFTSISQFEKIVGSIRPAQVMDFLNHVFVTLDGLCDECGVYKVETVGDSYMVASGLPEPTTEHATKLAKFALKTMAFAQTLVSPVDGSAVSMKIGMHTGSIMAGVVGTTRPRYCLFGDTVNVASRMTSTGVEGYVQYSASFMSELRAENTPVLFRPRGEVYVKGKGQLETFFLTGYGSEVDYLIPPRHFLKGHHHESITHQGKHRFFELTVNHTRTDYLVGVSSRLTIGDIVDTIASNLSTNSVVLQMFADEAHQQVLMPSLKLYDCFRHHWHSGDESGHMIFFAQLRSVPE
eukprot:m.57448 g.57448  ORF g.57448 m.57448 type:complete len:860 (-) comp11597_c0_seq8:485-3064(-)